MRTYRGEELQQRFVRFSVNVIKTCKRSPFDRDLAPLLNQLIRSSSSIALNHAEATGAGTIADFINKTRIALKEAEESKITLEILNQLGLPLHTEFNSLKKEADEICAILYASEYSGPYRPPIPEHVDQLFRSH